MIYDMKRASEENGIIRKSEMKDHGLNCVREIGNFEPYIQGNEVYKGKLGYVGRRCRY